MKRGDVDAGFKSATHVVERQFRIGGQEHFYMETNGARVVAKGEDGEVEVFVGCQGATTVQVILVLLLIVFVDAPCTLC